MNSAAEKSLALVRALSEGTLKLPTVRTVPHAAKPSLKRLVRADFCVPMAQSRPEMVTACTKLAPSSAEWKASVRQFLAERTENFGMHRLQKQLRGAGLEVSHYALTQYLATLGVVPHCPAGQKNVYVIPAATIPAVHPQGETL